MIIIVLGGLLSFASVALLVFLIRDARRRVAVFPDLRIAAWMVVSHWVRRTWIGVLLVGFLLGFQGYHIWSIRSMPSDQPTATARLVDTKRTEIRLPFLVRTVMDAIYADGSRYRRWQEVSLQIPWIFLIVIGFHWVLVARPRRG